MQKQRKANEMKCKKQNNLHTKKKVKNMIPDKQIIYYNRQNTKKEHETAVVQENFQYLCQNIKQETDENYVKNDQKNILEDHNSKLNLDSKHTNLAQSVKKNIVDKCDYLQSNNSHKSERIDLCSPENYKKMLTEKYSSEIKKKSRKRSIEQCEKNVDEKIKKQKVSNKN